MISGIIDDMESKLFKEIFNEKYNELNKKAMIPSPLPSAAIKGIPWIGDDQVVCDYLTVSTIIGFSLLKSWFVVGLVLITSIMVTSALSLRPNLTWVY